MLTDAACHARPVPRDRRAERRQQRRGGGRPDRTAASNGRPPSPTCGPFGFERCLDSDRRLFPQERSVIIPFTVDEILSELIAGKLA